MGETLIKFGAGTNEQGDTHAFDAHFRGATKGTFLAVAEEFNKASAIVASLGHGNGVENFAQRSTGTSISHA